MKVLEIMSMIRFYSYFWLLFTDLWYVWYSIQIFLNMEHLL